MRDGDLLDIPVESLMQMISKSVLFMALDRKGRTTLLDISKVQIFDPGELVVKEGDPGDSFYLIVEGKIEVFTESDGDYIHLATIETGHFFGEMAVFQNTPRSADCKATCETTLICFDKETIGQVLKEFPEARAHILQTMVDREEDNHARSLDHLLGIGIEKSEKEEPKKPGDDFDIF